MLRPRACRALLASLTLAACSVPATPAAVPASPAPGASGSRSAAPTRTPEPLPVDGTDISWPSCPVGTPGALPKKQGKGLPLPGQEAAFVVVGLTNGPGFHLNPCLAWEVQQVTRLSTAAYAFTTLPTPDQVKEYGGRGPYPKETASGRLRNAAWNEAQLNLAGLQRAGLRARMIWLDVEPQPYLAPWGTDITANRAVIATVRNAYRAAGYGTGFYSSGLPWARITGGLRSTDPAWVTVGRRGRAAAVTKCAGPTFSGGPAVLAQWFDGPTRDLDLVCPGVPAEAYFLAP